MTAEIAAPWFDHPSLGTVGFSSLSQTAGIF
jgi:hypothetical protein